MFKNLAQYHAALPDIAAVVSLLVGAGFAYWLANRFLVSAAHVFARRTEHTWDDAFIEHRVVSRLAQLVPGFIIYTGIDLLTIVEPTVKTLILNITGAYMILVVTFTLTAILSAINSIYESDPENRQRSIKGFVQLVQIVIIIIGLLLMIAALLDRSPVILLSGFGAMTAVVLLVFKDTILSLVASVQLSAQDMVRVGDWIEMPQFGADGDVIDVELHTIKIQNWDKTITTIPTHRLISDSFKNWRGMSASGGRRIKRCLHLDTSSIRFLEEDEIAHLKKVGLLSDYIEGKEVELAAHNKARLEAGGDANSVNLRRLTNVGTFRAYTYRYLRSHARIHKSMTLLVRQLAPSSQGLPIEIYCFTNTTEWNTYEDIQADIFDHLISIVPEFGLRLYQQPAGSDLSSLLKS